MKKSIVLLIALTLFTANIHAKHVRTVTVVNWSGNYNISIKTSQGQWIELPPKTYKETLSIDLDGVAGEQPQGDTLRYYSQFITAQCAKLVCIDKNIFSTMDGAIARVGNLTGQAPIYIILDAGRAFFGGIEKIIDRLGQKTRFQKAPSVLRTSSSLIQGICIGAPDEYDLGIVLKGLKKIK